jgi:hypothetical protein
MPMPDNRQRANFQQRLVLRVTVGMFSLTMEGASTTFGITMVEDQTKVWTVTSAVVFDAMALGHIF